MTAREMFKELGFEQIRNDGCFIKYKKADNGIDKIITFSIMFRYFDLKYGDYPFTAPYEFDIDTLKTINKQCEELGWIEEEKNEIKQETNFDHYKDIILDCCIDNLAVVKGIPKSCSKIDCNDCDFLTIKKECCEIAKDWLKQPYKKMTYKLTKFEKELLQCYPDTNSFKLFNSLNEMKEKGYFKGIDTNIPIREILDNCEVMD